MRKKPSFCDDDLQSSIGLLERQRFYLSVRKDPNLKVAETILRHLEKGDPEGACAELGCVSIRIPDFEEYDIDGTWAELTFQRDGLLEVVQYGH